MPSKKPPDFLGPYVELDFQLFEKVTKHFSLPKAAAGASNTKKLPFKMEPQAKDKWCWAAVARSVSRFFDPNSPWQQCNIAAACFGEPCCASPDPCNDFYTLDDPLRKTGNLQGAPMPGSDNRAGIKAQIDDGHPVCCHIKFDDGRGHFVVISGYDLERDDLVIQDPLYGRDVVPFSLFTDSYRNSGVWYYTFYTQP